MGSTYFAVDVVFVKMLEWREKPEKNPSEKEHRSLWILVFSKYIAQRTIDKEL